jgi:hypothetical protein
MRVVAIHDISALSESERDLLDEELDKEERLRGVELALFEVEGEDEGSPKRCVAARASQVEVGELVAVRKWAAFRHRVVIGDVGSFIELNFADELIPLRRRRALFRR